MGFLTKPVLPVVVDPAAGRHARSRAPYPVAAGDAQRPARQASPERPRSRVELPPESTRGRVVHVKSGENLQAALDAAEPGDHITLDPGATYTGPFRLLRKTGDQWIVITSAGQLPPRGRRVGPSDAARCRASLPRATSSFRRCPARTTTGWSASRSRRPRARSSTRLIQLGDKERTVDDAAAPHRHRALVPAWRQAQGRPPRRGAQLPAHGGRGFVPGGFQGSRRRLPGDRRLERRRAVPHREQLPRGGRRERHVRRRRPGRLRSWCRRTSRCCGTTWPSRCAGRTATRPSRAPRGR